LRCPVLVAVILLVMEGALRKWAPVHQKVSSVLRLDPFCRRQPIWLMRHQSTRLVTAE
jgi:hypothetical protein